jgi:hypothetical protein
MTTSHQVNTWTYHGHPWPTHLHRKATSIGRLELGFPISRQASIAATEKTLIAVVKVRVSQGITLHRRNQRLLRITATTVARMERKIIAPNKRYKGRKES